MGQEVIIGIWWESGL